MAPMGLLRMDPSAYQVAAVPPTLHRAHSQVEDAVLPSSGMTSPRKSVSGTELRVTVPTPRAVRTTHDEGLTFGAVTTLSRTVLLEFPVSFTCEMNRETMMADHFLV